jgi:hypothetical protein
MFTIRSIHRDEPKYELHVWEKADSVYEGIAVNGQLKAFRYCCGLDNCPSSVQFGEIPMTKEDARDFVDSDAAWAKINDPATTELFRLDA